MTAKTVINTSEKLPSWYGWWVILLCAFFLLYKYILQVSPSIMTSSLMRAFHVHALGLGNLAAMFFYAYFITQLFVGVLLDRYGQRFLCAFAIGISAVGAWSFAESHALVLASMGRLAMGVGAAFATVCYLKSASIWFPAKRFAFVSGLLATAAMLGAVLGEAPLSIIMHHVGWRSSLRIVGIIGVILALCFYIFVHDTKAPFGDQAQDHKVNLKDVGRLLKQKQTWLLMLYSGLTFSPVAVFGGLWGNPYIQLSYHLNHTQAAAIISSAFVGLAVGGPVLGWLSDYIQKRRLMMFIGNILSLITLLIAVYIPHLPHAFLVFDLFLFGFGIGAFMLAFAVGKEAHTLALAATVIALINSGDALCGAVSEPLVGAVLDWRWQHHGAIMSHGIPVYQLADYHIALGLMPIYLLVATGLLFWINRNA